MGYNESEANRQTNQDTATPRLRVNKTTNQTVTTSPTMVMYTGTSVYNTNSFTVIPGQTNPSVWYDGATGLFKFSGSADKNYLMDFTFVVTTAGLLAIGLSNISFRLSLEIQTTAKVNFPAPDFGGYIDVDNVNFNGQKNLKVQIPFFANSDIRTFGFGIKVFISAALPAGSVTLNGSDINLYPI